jgi:hypothetical protein
MACEHGSSGFNDEHFEDAMTLAFYSACDCCDGLMHKDTPYQMHSDGRTLCFVCRDESEPETLPAEW